MAAATEYGRLRDLSPTKRRELAAVMACDGEEHRYEEFVSYLEMEFASLDHESRAYVVAETDGVIAGFIRLWNSPHINEWVVDGTVVSPSRRRAGMGYALLLQAMDLATESGAPSVLAHVKKDNIPSISIVEKAGFQRETMDYLNSYGERRLGRGWQYRLRLPSDNARRRPDTS